MFTVELKEHGWSTSETKLLLEKYEEYMDRVGPMKKFKNLKAMWAQIEKDLAAEDSKKSGKQAETRWVLYHG